MSGNVDGYEASGFDADVLVELGGKRIALRHILYERGRLTKEGRVFLDRERPDICVFGHTHQPMADWYGATLLFNPGSAGPKRFSLPRRIGILTLHEGSVLYAHIPLPDRPARRARLRH